MIPPPRFIARYQAPAGRPADGFAAVSALLMRALAAGAPPAVSAAVVTSMAEVRYTGAGGWARLPAESADPVEATGSTAFDLASLTKVVATVPIVLLLHQRGAWSIDDQIARWLPGAPSSPVTIRQCLTHTAGLVPHRPFYEVRGTVAGIREAVVAELAGAAGGPVNYSDLGYMLLGWAIENCAGDSLDAVAGREIFGPLGMLSTSFRPSVRRTWVAATEQSAQGRGGLIWGEVHDGNAYALGGVSGHAGVFSTAADLGRFAIALLRPGSHPVLSAPSIELMTSGQAVSGADVRGLGWRLGSTSGWGEWPDGTIWHTGFTGTSLLVAPSLGVGAVLLTNAVHPARRRPAEITELRAGFHALVLAAL
ncbi:MAG TPA: serine hydrolase domain-containing protein [Streptosporangiaceae bacterium]|nr:serine hydrolase domain-containing protein [Streptosporangiaceae bacterium]